MTLSSVSMYVARNSVTTSAKVFPGLEGESVESVDAGPHAFAASWSGSSDGA
ncbi:hypothetical protein [Polyangium mundeleinium]|uniref:Uncharacterized protein n=1 Tax=Polyangium mundeleinium TaxID=2995306 RepID=A0ABT5EUE5_9BACT|nr:hypothetical protein [Polyangium mundeleinium]MDC0745448.1 hypothetical protein [Polyangium mundeleinium]